MKEYAVEEFTNWPSDDMPKSIMDWLNAIARDGYEFEGITYAGEENGYRCAIVVVSRDYKVTIGSEDQ